jgi:hypothetical protein
MINKSYRAYQVFCLMHGVTPDTYEVWSSNCQWNVTEMTAREQPRLFEIEAMA